MKEEYFDIVNDCDEVIGQRTRREVHQTGLLHRAVHVLLFNHRGEVFLQKRSMRKDSHPGAWDSSSSGHLDVGETYDACAVREVWEELGVELPAPAERLFKIDACEETGQEFVWIYRSRFEGPFSLNEDELDSGGWFAPGVVTRWMRERPEEFAPALVLIWGRLLEQKRV